MVDRTRGDLLSSVLAHEGGRHQAGERAVDEPEDQLGEEPKDELGGGVGVLCGSMQRASVSVLGSEIAEHAAC